MSKEYKTTPIYPYILVKMETLEEPSGIVAPDANAAMGAGIMLPKVLAMGYTEGIKRQYKTGDYITIMRGHHNTRDNL